MTRKVPDAVREYMAKIGRKGGANGRGKQKPREKKAARRINRKVPSP
jgi:hypothetical protein